MLIDKNTGKEITMFEEPISSCNPFNFLNGKKYIMTYKSLPKYCNSFMHIQRSLGISDVKWRTKKIDKKDCAIFLWCMGHDESEEEDEDDVSKKYVCDISGVTMWWHKHYKWNPKKLYTVSVCAELEFVMSCYYFSFYDYKL